MRAGLLITAGILIGEPAAARQGAYDSTGAPSGQELYRIACAACHGVNGVGALPSQVSFATPLPDFSDCSFASREPDADWVAVAHEGGPIRGFDRMMPAFGSALTVEQLNRVVTYIRGFCGDDTWPRGELNLPRPLITEKAYPEDEAVFTTTVPAEGGAFDAEFTYEKRFGARDQLEIVVPIGVRENTDPSGGSNWDAGLGDVSVGWKRSLFHSLASGTIVSVVGEVILPTGDESEGFGGGVVVFEPFLAVGQILPAEAFIQMQAGVELPAKGGGSQGFLRTVLGKSVTQGLWGRVWTPMIEILGAGEAGPGGTHWDLLPQLQVTLNTRQHVMANVGVRVPLTDTGSRNTEFLIYLLWDYFDGGLFAGW